MAPNPYEETGSGEHSSDEISANALLGRAPHEPPPSEQDFRALYDNNFRLVWRALARFGVRPADLTDVSQKVFLTVYLRLPQFERRSQLSTWLWGICRRVASSYRRSAALKHEIVVDPHDLQYAVRLDSPHLAPSDGPRMMLIDRVLHGLSLEQRTVFLLYEVDELDGPSIAALLDVPIGTVRSRLRYARRRFRREMKRATAAGELRGRETKQ